MSEKPEYGFNPKDINVLKITNATDIIIAEMECNHALERISKQLEDLPFGNDKEWIALAKEAHREISQKLQCVLVKKPYLFEKDAMHKQMKEAVKDPDREFRARFYKAAEKKLPPEIFEQLRETATMAKYDLLTNPN